jgi:hypothetical protein
MNNGRINRCIRGRKRSRETKRREGGESGGAAAAEEGRDGSDGGIRRRMVTARGDWGGCPLFHITLFVHGELSLQSSGDKPHVFFACRLLLSRKNPEKPVQSFPI